MKKFICVLLSLCLCLAMAVPVFADDSQVTDDSPEHITVCIWEAPTSQEDESTDSAGILRYGEREVVRKTEIGYATDDTIPSGQPTGGYCFPNGGSVYINTDSGPKADLSLQVSAAWDAITVTVNAGIVGSSTSAKGISVNIPANNNYYKVRLIYKYKITRKTIDYYSYNEYLRTGYGYRTELQSITATIDKI